MIQNKNILFLPRIHKKNDNVWNGYANAFKKIGYGVIFSRQPDKYHIKKIIKENNVSMVFLGGISINSLPFDLDIPVVIDVLPTTDFVNGTISNIDIDKLNCKNVLAFTNINLDRAASLININNNVIKLPYAADITKQMKFDFKPLHHISIVGDFSYNEKTFIDFIIKSVHRFNNSCSWGLYCDGVPNIGITNNGYNNYMDSFYSLITINLHNDDARISDVYINDDFMDLCAAGCYQISDSITVNRYFDESLTFCTNTSLMNFIESAIRHFDIKNRYNTILSRSKMIGEKYTFFHNIELIMTYFGIKDDVDIIKKSKQMNSNMYIWKSESIINRLSSGNFYSEEPVNA